MVFRTIKKAECWRTDDFKLWCWRRLKSPLDCKIKPVNLEGNHPWIFIRRTDAEAEASIFWPPNAKSWLPGKGPEAGKDWWQEEKGTTEDEMAGWHHWLDRHELEQAPGVGDAQRSLVCCSPWGCKSWTWLRNWITKGLAVSRLLAYSLSTLQWPGRVTHSYTDESNRESKSLVLGDTGSLTHPRTFIFEETVFMIAKFSFTAKHTL